MWDQLQAYSCHLNLFPVLQTLRDCTIPRAHYTDGATAMCSFFIYNALGIIAYCDLAGSLAPFSILESYDTSSVFTILVTAGILEILIGSSAAICSALRKSLMRVVIDGS
jgi:hypothetical protein